MLAVFIVEVRIYVAEREFDKFHNLWELYSWDLDA